MPPAISVLRRWRQTPLPALPEVGGHISRDSVQYRLYALLTHMIAQQCDLDVGEFIWTGGDCHIYLNHLEQARLQLSREPFPPPQLIINRKPRSIFDYQFEDFEIANYQAHPHIPAPLAV